MKKTYMKPEVEVVLSAISTPLCISDQPKGSVNTLFGSDLPEEQFGNDAWVNEFWQKDKKSYDPFEPIELGGNDEGTVYSR